MYKNLFSMFSWRFVEYGAIEFNNYYTPDKTPLHTKE